MTRVIITPEDPSAPQGAFRAATRGHESVGRTPGAALDALAQQLDENETDALIVVLNRRPDQYFTAAQRIRLSELLDKQRLARSSGNSIDSADNAELESLIDAELDGAARRAAAMASELRT